MTREAYFYRVFRSTVEQILVRLLQRSRGQGMRSLVVGVDRDHMRKLDERLWVFDDQTFLPHAVAGSDADPHQPILLATDFDNPNSANHLILLDGRALDLTQVSAFGRISIIFDGRDRSQVDAARRDWKAAVEAGISCVYWTDESGAWKELRRSGPDREPAAS